MIVGPNMVVSITIISLYLDSATNTERKDEIIIIWCDKTSYCGGGKWKKILHLLPSFYNRKLLIYFYISGNFFEIILEDIRHRF